MLNSDFPVIERRSLVHLFYCSISFLTILEKDIGEATRLLRVEVFNNGDVEDGAELGEDLA